MEKIEIKRKLVEEALDQLKAAQQDCYVESTQNVIDELELALRQPPASGSVCTCMAFHKSDECYELGCKAHRGDEVQTDR